MERQLTAGLWALAGFAIFMAGAALSTRLLHGAVLPGHLFCVRALVWIVWLVPWSLRHRQQVRASFGPWVVVAALSGTASVMGYVQALTLIAVPLATTLLYGSISPLVLFLDWVLFGRRPGRTDIVFLLGAIGGMAVIALPEGSYSPSNVSLEGALAALSSALTMAFYLMAVGRARVGTNVLNIVYAGTLLAVGLPTLVTHPAHWTVPLLGISVMYGVFTLIGQSLVVVGSQRVGAAAARASSSAIPIFATFLSWLFLHESVSALEVVALVVVVSCAGRVSLNIGSRNGGGPPPFRWSRRMPPAP